MLAKPSEFVPSTQALQQATSQPVMDVRQKITDVLARYIGSTGQPTPAQSLSAERADAAYFPVDCVSHLAAGQVKRLCRDAGKPFYPLRTASVASFISALSSLDRADCAAT